MALVDYIENLLLYFLYFTFAKFDSSIDFYDLEFYFGVIWVNLFLVFVTYKLIFGGILPLSISLMPGLFMDCPPSLSLLL